MLKSFLKCSRCGHRISSAQARTVAGLVFSEGCFTKISARQRMKSGSVSHQKTFLTCTSCGRLYESDPDREYVCGHMTPRCCFCCEYSTIKHQGRFCPFEAYLKQTAPK